MTVTEAAISNSSAPNGGGIYSLGAINLSRVTVDSNTALAGGGIFVNQQQQQIVNLINRSTISNNSANSNTGGGIYFSGSSQLTLVNSTIYGNTSVQSGGGIFKQSSVMNLINCTVTANSISAPNQNGGGIGNGGGGAIVLQNSIVAGNIGSNSSPDVSGDFTNSQYNLIGDGAGQFTLVDNQNGNLVGSTAAPLDALLGTLQNNGGKTKTAALQADSPAIDAGNNSIALNPISRSALTTDQRGVSRILNSLVDLGAVERYRVNLEQTSLPAGGLGQFYNQTLTATGGIAPYSFALMDGALPIGLTLDADGRLRGTPRQSGMFNFTVLIADSNPGSGFAAPSGIVGIQPLQLQIFAPTAAVVSISGKVSTAEGQGIRNAIVTITNQSGETRSARTNAFGKYSFAQITAGESYIVTVTAKEHSFTPQVVNLAEENMDVNFTAQ